MVDIIYRSNITFYSLKGVTFGNKCRMTRNHILVTSSLTQQPSTNPIYRIIKDLPLDKNSVHDIRLKFHLPDMYHVILSNNSDIQIYNYDINPISKDISLPVWNIGNLGIKVIIHTTDTVNVIVGCSYYPIVVDVSGLIRLTNALAIVRERLLRLFFKHSINSDTSRVPDYAEWVVTMWHFGADGSVEYKGERFCVTWQIAENALVRVYTKRFKDNKTRIRLERQEYPRATLADAIEQKINHNQWSGGD